MGKPRIKPTLPENVRQGDVLTLKMSNGSLANFTVIFIRKSISRHFDIYVVPKPLDNSPPRRISKYPHERLYVLVG